MEAQVSWSRGLLERVPTCPACGSALRCKRNYERRNSDDPSAMPDIWCMVRCASCSSLYLALRPDQESLPRAYASYYTHSGDTEPDEAIRHTEGFIQRLANGYLNRRFGMHRSPASPLGYWAIKMMPPLRMKLDNFGRRLSKRKYPNAGRLLEIGCGSGAFLACAADMGWDIVGCDPDPGAIAACNRRGLGAIQGDAFLPALDGQSFDVVTSSHVIEHIADQPAYLRRAFELLRPGGMLWLATPNADSLGFRLFAAGWDGLQVPYHLCIPSKNALTKMLSDCGFRDYWFPRCGVNGWKSWSTSREIGLRNGFRVPGKATQFACFALNCLLSTCSNKYGEETVCIAYKPAMDRQQGPAYPGYWKGPAE